MHRSSPMDPTLPAGEATDVTVPQPTLRHPPGHLLDNVEIAAQDELEHEAALRDSSLRVPR